MTSYSQVSDSRTREGSDKSDGREKEQHEHLVDTPRSLHHRSPRCHLRLIYVGLSAGRPAFLAYLLVSIQLTNKLSVSQSPASILSYPSLQSQYHFLTHSLIAVNLSDCLSAYFFPSCSLEGIVLINLFWLLVIHSSTHTPSCSSLLSSSNISVCTINRAQKNCLLSCLSLSLTTLEFNR